MNRWVLALLIVLATLLVFASGFAAGFSVSRLSFARYSYGPGMMGRGIVPGGMMGGGMMGPGIVPGGMMQGGMMGGMMQGRGPMMGGPGWYGNPAVPGSPNQVPSNPTQVPNAPKSDSSAPSTPTPAPTSPSTTSRSRGGMMGSGQTPGGLIAVSPNGKPLPADPTANLPANTAAQKVGNLNVSLALSPYPPAGFSRSEFDVTLKGEDGQAITDAKITLDLTMPAMPMPTNTPSAQHVGDGRYHATGLFTMRGLWRIQVIVDRGGSKQSAFFDVWL